MNDLVRLKWKNGEVSQPMPRERAAFILAFSFNNRPEIIEKNGDGDKNSQ